MIDALRRWRRRILPDRDCALRPLERSLGHTFARPELLWQALAHRSHVNSMGEDAILSNERIEFLGDAVVDLVVTDHLYRRYPDRREGDLSKVKSLVVSARVMARCAIDIDLGRYLLLSRSEEKAGGRDRESILADAYEAVIGALFLDGGVEPARRFLMRNWVVRFDEFDADRELANHKSQLLEITQGRGLGTPAYEVRGTIGPEHGKLYDVVVLVRGQEWGQGRGSNKKEAEQAAARNALERYRS